VRKQLPQHAPGSRIEGQIELEIELVLRVIRSLAGERKALPFRPHGLYLDFRERLVLRMTHGNLLTG